jgi:uncharacterized protein
MMILFFHGFNSSAQTNKFVELQGDKVCETVDYAKMSFAEVDTRYDQLIAQHNPDVIVGHSLGGYWALRKGKQHNIPSIIVNPQLFPGTKFADYVPVNTESFVGPGHVISYVETGDEVIKVPETLALLEATDLRVYEGGHHRVERVSYINTLVADSANYQCIG